MRLGSFRIRTTKTKRQFSLDEVYEILKEEADLPGEPYIHGTGLLRTLAVPGIGKYDVAISVQKSKIVCSESVAPGEQAGDLVLTAATRGWASFIDPDSWKNEAITNLVGDEIERLFADRI